MITSIMIELMIIVDFCMFSKALLLFRTHEDIEIFDSCLRTLIVDTLTASGLAAQQFCLLIQLTLKMKSESNPKSPGRPHRDLCTQEKSPQENQTSTRRNQILHVSKS